MIGGGAAGIFAAAMTHSKSVLVLEQSNALLSKVKISGGGRCNVTHHCFDPAKLVEFYPRGGKELRGPFTRFGPLEMVEWLRLQGVEVKTEEDGRMFPVTDSSQTIIDCLLQAAERQGVMIEKGQKVVSLEKGCDRFCLHLKSGDTIEAKKVLLASGSSRFGYELARELGHTVTPPVPSLFTFNVPGCPLNGCAGISVPDAKVSLPGKLDQQGPLLITHWGFSGPAVLKLSAFAARELHDASYEMPFWIDWCPGRTQDEIVSYAARRVSHKKVAGDPLIPIAKKLWRALVSLWGVSDQEKWSELSKKQRSQITEGIKRSAFSMLGKTTHKEEFVTCGGVKLSEVNFKTMESKKVPGLYFSGEVLDIDGVTGGFNFQAAWTCSWTAAQNI